MKKSHISSATGFLCTSLLLFGLSTLPAGAEELGACVKGKKGKMRLVTGADECKKNETHVTWNSEGPQGTQGLPGADGADGADGATGPAGADNILRADVCGLFETLNATYSLGATVPDYCPPAVDNYIFASSTRYQNANFGGVAGADTNCQNLATAAGHAGTYRALLSTSNVSARDRLMIRYPLRLVDGTLIATDNSDMWDGSVPVRINLTEVGGQANWHLAVTGTDSDGVADRAQFTSWCSDWQSPTAISGVETGRTDRQDSGWIAIYGDTTQHSINSCSAETLLYCLRTTQ